MVTAARSTSSLDTACSIRTLSILLTAHNVPVDAHPIRLLVEDDLRRSRLTVVFRLPLSLPPLLWVVLWGIAAFFVAFVMWFAVLFERRAPGSLHRFVAGYVRYTTQTLAYFYLAADPYPWFTPREGYPVDVEIDPPTTQGRWGAGFRLLLALPALVLTGVLSGGGGSGSSSGAGFSSTGGTAIVAAFLGWFAILARGRMPRGLRDLVVYGLGYGAQTYGYSLLLTPRYPNSDPDTIVGGAELPSHPVRVVVTDELRRARLLVFFRLALTIPHIVWFLLWTIPAVLAVIAGWVAALVTGRLPLPLHRFLAAYTRYGAHWYAFATVVGGPFPGFVGKQGSYPVDMEIDPPERQSRWTVLFRFLLAIPALLIGAAYGGVLLVVAVLGWFASLFTGRMPGGLRNLGAVCLRYTTQANAYCWLLTPRYPYSAPVLHGRRPPEPAAMELEPPGAEA
jgi:hypothetical protein